MAVHSNLAQLMATAPAQANAANPASGMAGPTALAQMLAAARLRGLVPGVGGSTVPLQPAGSVRPGMPMQIGAGGLPMAGPMGSLGSLGLALPR